MEDHGQEPRKHVFAINTSPEFLNIVRELFQEEGYNVTTTNFAPNSFQQIEALQPDALIIDIAIGQEAGWELLEQLERGCRYRRHPRAGALHRSAAAGAGRGAGEPATALTAFWPSRWTWTPCWRLSGR